MKEGRMLSIAAQQWVDDLELVPHPEGGFYREYYRACEKLSIKTRAELLERRNLVTSMYFLLPGDSFSAFHRLQSEELWYYHSGAAVEIIMLTKSGECRTYKLGVNLADQQTPIVVVPAGIWFCAYPLAAGDDYSLVSCVVAPGFEFADFELGDRDQLLSVYPQHFDLIRQYTRDLSLEE